MTGRPLIKLPRTAGQTDSEMFFDALAMNSADLAGTEDAQQLLASYTEALAKAFAGRTGLLTEKGRVLPGARQALSAVGSLPGVVQSVLTGTIMPNAVAKLQAFGLDRLVDFAVGGYGSEAYPKGTLLQVARGRAAEAHGVSFGESATAYIGDSPRDVEAARIGGAWAIGVATGRSTASELTAAGADAVLDGLTDTTAVVQAVNDLTSPAT